MHARRPRLTFAALFSAVVFLSSASAANAVPPTSETLVDEGLLTLPDFDCGSFTLHEELLSERATFTTFYGDDGAVVRTHIHISFVGEILNLATNETFRDHASVSIFMEGDDVFESGIGFNIIRSGQGAVVQLIGRRFVDSQGNVVVVGGADDVQGDLQAAFCTALA